MKKRIKSDFWSWAETIYISFQLVFSVFSQFTQRFSLISLLFENWIFVILLSLLLDILEDSDDNCWLIFLECFRSAHSEDAAQWLVIQDSHFFFDFISLNEAVLKMSLKINSFFVVLNVNCFNADNFVIDKILMTTLFFSKALMLNLWSLLMIFEAAMSNTAAAHLKQVLISALSEMLIIYIKSKMIAASIIWLFWSLSLSFTFEKELTESLSLKFFEKVTSKEEEVLKTSIFLNFHIRVHRIFLSLLMS